MELSIENKNKAILERGVTCFLFIKIGERLKAGMKKSGEEMEK